MLIFMQEHQTVKTKSGNTQRVKMLVIMNVAESLAERIVIPRRLILVTRVPSQQIMDISHSLKTLPVQVRHLPRGQTSVGSHVKMDIWAQLVKLNQTHATKPQGQQIMGISLLQIIQQP